MTFESMADALNLTLVGPDGTFPQTLRVDSRQVAPGEGFAAFEGAHVDGHDYIEQAIRQGAKLIVARRDRLAQGLTAKYRDVSFLLVEGPTDVALAQMAKTYLASLPALKSIAAITGSVGKTSTRSFLTQILSTRRCVHSSQGNYNTLIGCAVTALAAPLETQILVLEMGANHPGEIAQMVEYFPPSVACITEVAPAHLEGFGSLEGVLAAKCEILTSSQLRAAVINGDNERLAYRAPQMTDVPLVTVGEQGTLSFSHPRISWDEGYHTEATLSLVGVELPLHSRVSGEQNLYPLACAVAMALQLGMPFGDAVAAAATLGSLPGRGEVTALSSGAWLIDESYNASPKSMEASIHALCQVEVPGRKIVLLGDMYELGEGTTAAHRSIFEEAKNCGFDWLRLWGEGWEKLPEAQAFRLREWEELENKLRDLNLGKGDVMLIKGSHASGLGEVVAGLKGEAK